MTLKIAKQVILIRKDLKMNTGKMVAQGAHASLDCVLDSININKYKSYDDNNPFYLWNTTGRTKIVLEVNSLEELEDIESKAISIGLVTSKVTDEGRTIFNGVHTITALGIGPDFAHILDTLTAGLKLLR